MLSERVCDGGIRWLAPSNEARKRNEKRKTGKGGWAGMGMPLQVVLVTEENEEGRKMPLLVCCGTAGDSRLRLLSCMQTVGFVIPSPCPSFQIFVLSSWSSLYIFLKVFPQGFGLFVLVLFCLLIPHFNDLSINLLVSSVKITNRILALRSKVCNIHNRTRRITTQSRVRGTDMRGKR